MNMKLHKTGSKLLSLILLVGTGMLAYKYVSITLMKFAEENFEATMSVLEFMLITTLGIGLVVVIWILVTTKL